MMRIVGFLLMLFVLGVLPGCAAITEPFGIEDPFAIPKPFQGVARNNAMINFSSNLSIVVVELPRGVNQVLGEALRDKVISTLQARDVAALTQTELPAWTLKGRAAMIEASEKKGGLSTVVVWRVFDSARREKGRFSVLFRGQAVATVEPRLADLADEIASEVVKLMPEGTGSEPAVAEHTKLVVSIGAIKGAPGDGNTALARAMMSALPLQGIRVEPDPIKSPWRAECTIVVEQKSPTEDRVSLTWRLLDAKGREAGTLTQENPVPKGRLNKPWREIAGFAAEAAAEGLLQILQQVSPRKR